MNKRKTVNIRVHRLQRWTAKVAASKLDCPIHEMTDRLFAVMATVSPESTNDPDVVRAMAGADHECRSKENEAV